MFFNVVIFTGAWGSVILEDQPLFHRILITYEPSLLFFLVSASLIYLRRTVKQVARPLSGYYGKTIEKNDFHRLISLSSSLSHPLFIH